MAHKKTDKAEQIAKLSWRQIVFSIALALIVAGSIYVLTSFAVRLFYEAPRSARVKEIVRSLQLPASYLLQGSVLAPDTRVYKEDGTRSWSSTYRYIRGADLPATLTELNSSIEKAGFQRYDETYQDSTIAGRHYRNDKGEYIHATFISKARAEYFQNANIMQIDNDTIQQDAVDPNTGPINITLLINLDNDRK